MNLREIVFGFVSLQSLDEMSHVCYLPTTLTFPLLYQAFSVASFISRTVFHTVGLIVQNDKLQRFKRNSI